MLIADKVTKESDKSKKINDLYQDGYIAMIKHRERFLDEKINQEYKKLKTLLMKGYQDCKVFLIVSSLPGEGSTSVALHLAKELCSENGRKVILIDANLRNPALSIQLSMNRSEGLFEILKDATFTKAKRMVQGTVSSESSKVDVFMTEAEKVFEENVSRFIRTTDARNLLAISSGVITNENILGAENENIGRLMNYLKKNYDYVLIDGAPANLYSDSLLIAPHADGVILVVEAERTKKEIINKVKEDFENVKGSIIGIILNKQRYYIPESIYKMI